MDADDPTINNLVINNDVSVKNTTKNGKNKCGYEYQKELGTGTYGKVYRIKGPNGNLFAVKEEIEKPNAGGISSINEIDVMFRLVQPNLNQGLQILTPLKCDVTSLAIVMDLATGDLMALFKMNVPLKDRIRIMYEIGYGILFMHDTGILHLDIKAENILYRGSPNKPISIVSDFGLSQYVDDPKVGRTINRDFVTITYRAPEILAGSRIYTSAVDVWSLGILYLEILSNGRKIFTVDTDVDFTVANISAQVNAIFNDRNRDTWLRKYLSTLSRQVIDQVVPMLSGMLNPNPLKRMELKRVLVDPFFKSWTFSAPIDGTIKVVPQVPLPDANPIIKEGVEWIINTMWVYLNFEMMPVSTLFLAVDLYYRSVPYGEYNLENVLLVAATCIWIAVKMIVETKISIQQVLIEAAQNKFSKQNIDQMELGIIDILEGNLYRKYIYGKAQTYNQLIQAYPILTNIEVYPILDVDQWLATLPVETKPKPKDVTIEDYTVGLI